MSSASTDTLFRAKVRPIPKQAMPAKKKTPPAALKQAAPPAAQPAIHPASLLSVTTLSLEDVQQILKLADQARKRAAVPPRPAPLQAPRSRCSSTSPARALEPHSNSPPSPSDATPPSSARSPPASRKGNPSRTLASPSALSEPNASFCAARTPARRISSPKPPACPSLTPETVCTNTPPRLSSTSEPSSVA